MLTWRMGDLFIRVVLATFVLSISLRSSESYTLNDETSVTLDNGTPFFRQRRQAQEQSDEPIRCRTPRQPSLGQWTYLTGEKGGENETVDVNTVIMFSCNPGYQLSNTFAQLFHIACLTDGQWSVLIFPTCLKLCPAQHNSPLVNLTCKNDGSIVPCDKATDNTVLTYRCAPYYERAYGKPEIIVCLDGSWDATPECVPECGKRVSATPLIVNGQAAERGNHPWVVAIYTYKANKFHFTCSGSLITPDVVLTAAHCMTASKDRRNYSPSYYQVGAGKYFFEFEDSRDNDTAQYAEVTDIEISAEFDETIANFHGDIALLRLERKFALSKFVQPVCFRHLPDLVPGDMGSIAGWGYITSKGHLSDTLEEIELPFYDTNACFRDLSPNFASTYLTADKFCAGFQNKSKGICRGDAGGSLVFRNPSYMNRFFIHGILSVSPSYAQEDQRYCNIQTPALYTSVKKYDSWIQFTLRRWENNLNLCLALPDNPLMTLTCKNDNSIVPCDMATEHAVLTYECASNYERGTPERIVCVDSLWDYIPQCYPALCPPLYNSPLIELTCKNNGLIVSCDKATNNTVLTYKCAPYYERAHGKPESIVCLNKAWSDTPKCVPGLCSAQYNTSLFSVTCINDGSIIPCDKATEKTVLTYKCAPHYERAHGKPKEIVCSKGSWDHTPECVLVCGQKKVTATPLIVGGKITEKSNYPWVVAIYSYRESSPYFTNICGGSLLKQDVVLTAAHCVTKKETGRIYPKRYYRVSVGKYYNQYEDERDEETAQYSELMEIKTHDEYGGELQNFRADIALLRLKTRFLLTKTVQPVCFRNLPDMIPETSGLVSGWGFATSSGDPSDVLKYIELPFTDQTTCAKELDQDFVSLYLLSDKFCAGFNNKSTSVCRGDSGGGLVYRNPHYKNRFFIHGIVSLGHSYIDNQERHCNIQARALFTRVNKYKEWIELTLQRWENIPAV